MVFIIRIKKEMNEMKAGLASEGEEGIKNIK